MGWSGVYAVIVREVSVIVNVVFVDVFITEKFVTQIEDKYVIEKIFSIIEYRAFWQS